ncbi:hypothetical protein NC652_031540 [Populus alba x Populus x berolinensis]|nr:hypothetical protein NC652_031540 [Populus alba x Populus x berolinensis]
MAVWAVMVLAITEVIVRSTALFFCRHILGYASRSEEDILNHVADMDPFICLSAIVDRLQPVLSGVARGSGWKNGGAFVNLVGTPVRRCWLLLYTQGGRAFCLD